MENNRNAYPVPGDLTSAGIASSTECTGLVQGLPLDGDNMEAYAEIYDIPEQGGLGVLEERVNKTMKKQKEQNSGQGAKT